MGGVNIMKPGGAAVAKSKLPEIPLFKGKGKPGPPGPLGIGAKGLGPKPGQPGQGPLKMGGGPRMGLRKDLIQNLEKPPLPEIAK